MVIVVFAFLDMIFVGLEVLLGLGEERFVGDFVCFLGGGAIIVIGVVWFGFLVVLVLSIAFDPVGEMIREVL